MKNLFLLLWCIGIPMAFGAEFVIYDSTQGAMDLERLVFQALNTGAPALPDDLEISIRRIQAGPQSADVIAAELAPGEPPPEGLTAVRIARYPVIVAVHAGNPIRGMQLDSIRRIFTGQLKTWAQLGPWQGDILRAGVKENTPSGRAFRKFVMKQDLHSAEMPLPGHDILPGVIWLNSPEFAKGLATAENVILFGGWELTSIPGLRVLEIDKVAPTAENVASGRYPWRLDHVLLYKKAAPPAQLDAVVRYFRSGAIRAGAIPEKTDEK